MSARLTARTVPSDASVVVQLDRDVCDDDLRKNAVVHARTLGEVTLSDHSTLPVNTPVILKVAERRVAAGDQDPMVALEATLLDASPAVPIATKALRFVLEKPSVAGTVVKGTVIGAIGGATLGLVLHQNVARSAAIGGAAGGAVGALKATTAQACVSAKSTTLPFVVAARVGP